MSKSINRLDDLKAKLEAEKKGDNDPRYISDLLESIECLQNAQPMPKFIMVN